MSCIVQGFRPAEPLVVGHWAERLVGNYLMRKEFLPFFAYNSKGAFDIYVKVRGVDVGIQVKYSSSGVVNLGVGEFKRIIKASEETGWVPILALFSKKISFFIVTRAGRYEESMGVDDLEDLISKNLQT